MGGKRSVSVSSPTRSCFVRHRRYSTLVVVSPNLYQFLRERGWRGRYTGVDIVPDLLSVARVRHPEIELHQPGIVTEGGNLKPHDFVIASGVFNARLKVGDNRMHICEASHRMHALSRIAVCVDFLSTFVDFEKPEAWHTDPDWVLAEARALTRRILLRLDYMPFEFALFLFRDDSLSERNVLIAAEVRLEHEHT